MVEGNLVTADGPVHQDDLTGLGNETLADKRLDSAGGIAEREPVSGRASLDSDLDAVVARLGTIRRSADPVVAR